ncbi:LytTR family DNA-binding domain-containing protein [Hyphobacterium sp. HN65]|uniref:LytTR family DNA-binding domain-containing protein n=1 Tax=Hyphobacterium lacteum TaxID=3116575 RepID=A0ABU7LS54_9PROT|nr:LytTR family DNA-binding domain-containing protein [Hyphobacterium sp. HN65]MEE2526710.1 LytTR family DNA-binding domain-containing protein [Hyphobacterium sp. HN65]
MIIHMESKDQLREAAAEARTARNGILTIGVLIVGVWLVNSTSLILDRTRGGADPHALEAFFREGSSSIIVFLLAFAVMRWERRYPLTTGRWTSTLSRHLMGVLVFSVVHIVALGLVRDALYPLLFNATHDFFRDQGLVFLYEGRKDIIAYIAMILIFTAFRTIEWQRLETESARSEARTGHRLTLKCGGRTLYVEAEGFETARAAGNYAEIRLATGEQLARITLAELQTLLSEAGQDVVRVHRSWLVNRRLIEEIIPTGEGDVTLRLTNGETIPGSRRYRSQLEAA